MKTCGRLCLPMQDTSLYMLLWLGVTDELALLTQLNITICDESFVTFLEQTNYTCFRRRVPSGTEATLLASVST